MPQEITAERTAEIVAFVRRVLGDKGYAKYPSNDMFYSIGNAKIEEIAEQKKNIKEDIEIKLSPHKYYYDEADIVEQLEDIIRVDKVFLRYSDNTESMPMVLVPQSRFEEERKVMQSDPIYHRYPNLQYIYDSKKRRFYYIDENFGFYYWQPVADNDTRLIIKCSRNAITGELMNDENNPKIARSWDKFIRAGILSEACAFSTDPQIRSQEKYWTIEFNKYKLKGVSKTKEMPLKAYKEF